MKINDITSQHVEWLEKMIDGGGNSPCFRSDLNCPEKCKLCPLSAISNGEYPITDKDKGICRSGRGRTAHKQSQLVLDTYIEDILLGADSEDK